MISEAQWKVIKHNDLAMFNRPRLDLVVHVLINRLLPRVRVMLANVLHTRRLGRAVSPNDWQSEFRALWLDMSKSDEQRNIERQLEILKSVKKMKGRTEKLAELEAEAERPSGTYYTDIDRWTCSCPSYLISRFLLCKHLVRTANARMPGFDPKDNLAFFAALQRNHFPPFYYITALHDHLKSSTDAPVAKERPARKVLRGLEEAITDGSETADSSSEKSAVPQIEFGLEGGLEAGEGMGNEVRNKDQQEDQRTCVAPEHVNDRASSVLTESEDGDNEHQVL